MNINVLNANKCVFKKENVLYHYALPVENHYKKKNNRKIVYNKHLNRSFLGKDSKLVKGENYLINKFSENFPTMIDIEVWCIFLFYYDAASYYTKAGARKKKLGDLSNHYQIVEDCLEKAGVILNDDLIRAHDLSRILVGDQMALEVFILDYNKSIEA